MKETFDRLYSSTLRAFPTAGKTILWLLKIIIPISLAVSLLQYWGIIASIANILEPAFSLIGLPGESAIVFISSIFLTLYAPIAVIATLSLDMREITILALMCLISHNLFVESAVQKKTGSSAIIMFLLRIITSFIGAYLLNLLLPDHIGGNLVAQKTVVFNNITDMLTSWLVGASWLVLKITLIITGLMILQSILKEFKILDILSKIFAPLMRLLGLSADSSFLWFVAQTIGLTYGSAVLIEEVENNEISLANANLLNYHIAINHSLLEDTLLFVAIGVPAGWIIAPRFILAIIVVWGVRGIIKLKN
ncbi:MAG: nucleoside recognition domain-containing protein [Paludibacter sp.]